MRTAENIEQVRQRIHGAARRSGRDPSDVTLIAVSKTFPPEAIREAYAVGLRVFGESRVQEAAGKVEQLSDLRDMEWHMIGHLQTNKAAKGAALFSAIDSVDSLRLAQKLNEAAAQLGKKLDVLIEINIGGEVAKSGALPGSDDLRGVLQAAPLFDNLQFRGLMTVPPYTEDPEGARPYFHRLKELRDEIVARELPGVGMNVLSMGMSHDFEVAIEEGATVVRVGTAIFGER